MKKKKKKQDKLPDDAIEKIASLVKSDLKRNNISDSQINELFEKLMSIDVLKSLNEQYYRYKKPDYTANIKPLHPALQPVMERYEPVELNALCDDVKKQLSTLSADQQRDVLINGIYHILANPVAIKDKTASNLPLFIIINVMEELGVTGVTDVLLELLRQDAYFTDSYIAAFDMEMAFAIGRLCKDDIDKLEQFMHEKDIMPDTISIVADAVIFMATENPTIRLTVISFFARVFDKYLDAGCETINIDHIAKSLALIKAKELLPRLDEIYATGAVFYSSIRDNEDLYDILNNGDEDNENEIGFKSISEVFDMMESRYDPETGEFVLEDDDDWDDEDDWDEDVWEDVWEDDDEEEEDFENDSLTPDEGISSLCVPETDDQRSFVLDITLDNSPVPVKRTIKVPSNIRLSALNYVIIAVMGWDNSHLSQFKKGKYYFTSNYVIKDSWGRNSMVDYDEVALNQLLKRKGSNISFEYDFGDSWMHTIRVIEQAKVNPGDKDAGTVTLISAEGACPPEDVGGVWGYAEMLEALKDRHHEMHDEYKEWLGARYNPNKVSLPSLRSRLKDFLNSID